MALPLFASALAASLLAAPRPPHGEAWCSDRVCVHHEGDRDGAALVARFTEAVLDELDTLELPPPLPDGLRGGSPQLDVYLAGAATDALAVPDVSAWPGFRRASGFVKVAGVAAGPGRVGCIGRFHLRRAVIEVSLLALDAEQHPNLRRAHASYLSSLLAPCPAVTLAAVDDAQRRPHRAWTAGNLWAYAAWLDDHFDTGGAPAAGVRSALAAVTVGERDSPPSIPSSHPMHVVADRPFEPDLFDALRPTLLKRGSDLETHLLDFSVARLFAGSRADGGWKSVGHPGWGSLGRPRFTWRLADRSLPRRVGPQFPLEPTGAAFVWLDTSAHAHPGYRVVAEHEVGHVLSWAVIALDASGRRLFRRDFGGVYGQAQASLTLDEVEMEVQALVFVASHAGNDDRGRPYDPDDGPPRPAGWELTVYPR